MKFFLNWFVFLGLLIIAIPVCQSMILHYYHPEFYDDYQRLNQWTQNDQCLSGLNLYAPIKDKMEKFALLTLIKRYHLVAFENHCQSFVNKGINWEHTLSSPEIANQVKQYITSDDESNCNDLLKHSRQLSSQVRYDRKHQSFVHYMHLKSQACFQQYGEKPGASQFLKIYRQFTVQNSENCQYILNTSKELLRLYQEEGRQEFEFMIPIYQKKAYCHTEVWQHHEAKRLLQKLESYTGEKHYSKDIRKADVQIEKGQEERNNEINYNTFRNLGAASTLKNQTLMVMIYIDTPKYEWGRLARHQSEASLELVQQWYMLQAKQYHNETLSFKLKSFHINQHKEIDYYFKLITQWPLDSKQAAYDTLSKLIARRLGYPTPGKLSSALKAKQGVDNVMLYFNFKKRGRSFAIPCYNNRASIWKQGDKVVSRVPYSSCEGEYTFVFSDPKHQRWQSYHYTVAHEGLHLFGAGDLYNIKNAKNYATEDIMHYPSKFLEHSSVKDLTAYGIGWRSRPSNIPFPVIDIGN